MNPNEVGDGVWWLNLLLARTFFMVCGSHTNLRSQLNHYCIDCDMAACQNCMAEGNHANHRVLKLYRLVYKEVVSLNQMSTYIDCSRIQPYASNGKQVLALHPLPHLNSGQLNRDRACRTCSRKLMNPQSYSYCSIACKLSIQAPAAGHGDPGAGSSGAGAGSSGAGAGSSGAGTGSGKHSKRSDSRKSRRKGVPHRAAFF